MKDWNDATKWTDQDWADIIANPQPPDDPDEGKAVETWVYFEDGKLFEVERPVRKTIKVTVPWDLAQFTDRFALALFEYKQSRGAVHQNNLEPEPERDKHNTFMGIRAEGALYFFFGGKKAGAQWDTTIGGNRQWGNTPDIIFDGHKYDAKGIDRAGLSLLVYKGGVHSDWRYALVDVTWWPQAELLGWCTGEEVLRRPLQEKVAERPAHFVPQRDLYSCGTLI